MAEHSIVTGPEVSGIPGMDHIRRGHFKIPKGNHGAFKRDAIETEKIPQLNSLSGLSEDPSVWDCWGMKNNKHWSLPRQCPFGNTAPASPVGPRPWDGPWIGQLWVLSRTCSPFNSPTQPECQSNGSAEVDYGGLNEVTPLLRAGHAPGVETQLHCLSLTDPDCTGKGWVSRTFTAHW